LGCVLVDWWWIKMAMLAGMGISAIGGLLGGLFGRSAAKKASEADKQAASIEQQAGAGVQRTTQAQLAQGQAELSPYVSAGAPAFQTVASLMGEGAQGQGPLASFTGEFQAPTAAQAEATPGYQFQLEEGRKALENSAAAKGGILSTGMGKQLEQYGQGLASTNYSDTYNRAMQQYQQQYQQFLNNQNNLYSRLMGVGQTGLGAAEQSGTLGMQGAQISGQQGLTAAQGQAGYTAAAGGAKALGTSLLGNSISGAMGAIGGGLPGLFPSSGGGQLSATLPGGGPSIASIGAVQGSGGYAAGGKVRKGKKILVGEQGPEWFTPGSSGRIIPNPMTVANMMGA
jgi:hypothetical protein